MLYDLEPDRSVTGGSWYSDQDFESEFVQVLHQQVVVSQMWIMIFFRNEINLKEVMKKEALIRIFFH